MTRTVQIAGLLLILPLLTISFAPNSNFDALAQEPIDCMEGEVTVVRTTNPTPICVSEDTANRWVQLGLATIVSEPVSEAEATETKMEEETTEKKVEEKKTEKKMEEATKAETKKPTDAGETMEKAKMEESMKTVTPTTKTGTLVSSQDPGIGHESHQLAVILPPSDKIYRGHLTYSASEPIQLVALHGPLGPGEDKGQPIWTPDGETKFALTFVEAGNSAGVWQFSGNAIAVHTMNSDPFTVSYSVTYTENAIGDNIIKGTITSSQDPGIGHESHQLAVVLPPRDVPYRGHLTYDASEPIQLVALIGPLKGDQVKGQAIWTPDGETNYALVLVDPKKSAGSWVFSGNAIAFHTMTPEPFTVSYSIVLTR